ncbi:MAG: SWIM zinc finger family protein [Chloroflexi bacterium]|nr:SWIM zinc finger family protein [Chloroflexota bacterium]
MSAVLSAVLTGVRPTVASKASNGDWRIEEVRPGLFQVGQVGGSMYDVEFHPDWTWTCSCPDFQHRGASQGPCKHIVALWLQNGRRITTVTDEQGTIRIVPRSLFSNPDQDNPIRKGATMNGNTSYRPTTGQGQSAQAVRAAQRPGQPVSSQVAQRPGQPVPDQPPAWMRDYQFGDELPESYPYIQWVNRGEYLVPNQPVGGFAAPLDQEVPLPGIYAELHHPNGGMTEVMYTDQIQFCALRSRFFWVDRETNVRLPGYQPGAKGKLQVLGYLKTDDGFYGLVMLTFAGLSGNFFNQARLDFARAVRKATNGKAPTYAFWMTIVAGKTTMVGKKQKSPISPPQWNGDFDPNRDFVGNELLDSIPWDTVERWAKLAKKPGPNGEGEIQAVAEEEEYYDEEPVEEIPF